MAWLTLLVALAGCHRLLPFSSRNTEAGGTPRVSDGPREALDDQPDQMRAKDVAGPGDGPRGDLCTACVPTLWTQVIFNDRLASVGSMPCPPGWMPFLGQPYHSGPGHKGCPDCQCGLATGENCTATVLCTTDSSCSDPACGETPISGGCVKLDTTYCSSCNYVKVTFPPAPSGGSCTAIIPAPLPYSWLKVYDVCVPATASPYCTSACLPSPASFPHVGCLVGKGDLACPPGFPKKTVVFANATDQRTCTCGPCSAPSGGLCPSYITLHGCLTCVGGSQTTNASTCYAPPAALTCGSLSLAVRAADYSGVTAPGACTPAKVQISGDVIATNPITLCCP